MIDSKLEIVFILPLLQLLIFVENNKGLPLTKEEVSNVCDNATGVLVSKDRARKLEISRGYKDINPENCWAEWQAYKNKSI